MLARKRRAPKALLEQAQKAGQSYHSPLFSLRVLKVGGSEPSTFAFVVSAKVAKRAVGRNLLKRRGSYALHKLLPSLKSGYCGIFFFKKGASAASYQTLETEIQNLLSKASLVSAS